MFDPAARRAVESVARTYNIEAAALLAIAWVESAGRPYWHISGKDMPAIRFEGHYFHQRLSGEKLRRAIAEGLAAKRAGQVRNPNDYAARYAMLQRAMAIDPDAALESISMGLGQVMGAWWQDLGYPSVKAMWEQCLSGIAGQVTVMEKYLAVYGLLDDLRAHRWKKVAVGYNGPAQRGYDVKLAAAYKAFAAGTVEQEAAAETARRLRKLGYRPQPADDGQAVAAFQEDRGLVVDGDAGPMVREELDAAIAEDRATRAPGNAGTAAGIGTGIGVVAVKEVPDIVEAIRQGGDAAWSVQSVVDAIGLPGIVGGIIVAAAVGYVVYRLVKRAQPPGTPARPGLLARLKAAVA